MRLAYIALFAITAAYVSFEIPFAARLVDVMSSPLDADRLHRYETVGRILSGIAVGLAAASFLILRRPNSGRAIVASAVGAAMAAGVYFGERSFVDAQTSDPGTRAGAQLQGLALRSMMVEPALASPHIAEVALGLQESPEGRTAIAMSAHVGSYMPLSVYEGFDARSFFSARIAPHRPDAAAFRSTAIPGAQDVADRLWSIYRASDEARDQAIRTARRDFDRRWTRMAERFAKDYGADKMRRCDIGIMGRSKMRREIMLAGVTTPENWNICDRAFVERKAMSAIMKDIDARWDGGPIKIEPGVQNKAAFLAHASVRKIIHEAGVPMIDGRIVHAGLDDRTIETIAIPASIESQVDVLHRRFNPSLSGEPRASLLPSFPDGPAVEQIQRAAVEAAIVPILAIALSIAGAVYHMAKLAGLAVGALGLRSIIRPKLAFLVVLAALLAMPAVRELPHPVSVTLDRVSDAPGLSNDIAAARWMIGAAGMLYSAGRMIERVGPFHLLDAYLEGRPRLPDAIATADLRS